MSCVSGPGLLQRLPCLGTIRSGQQNRPNAARLFVDLYDKQSGKIPFDKFEQFFRTNLK